MKEFSAQEGGRYTYADDVMNLQDLALAFGQIFDGCDNFVLSGCKISGKTMAAGYVWMNGKIRYCEGSSNISKYPCYIVEHNSVENVGYANASNKVGRTVYGCKVMASLPTNNDPITSKPAQYIAINESGFNTIQDAFFGKYAVLLNNKNGKQSIQNPIDVNGDVTSSGSIKAGQGFHLEHNGNKTSIIRGSGGFSISSGTNGTYYKLEIKNNGDLQYSHNGSAKLTISGNKVYSHVHAEASSLQGGNIKIAGTEISNVGTNADSDITINLHGYNGQNTYYRDLIVGNGKNGVLAKLNAKERKFELDTSMVVSSASSPAITLKNQTQSKTDNAYTCYFGVVDKNVAVMAKLGYTSSSDNHFYISNLVGDVVIDDSLNVTGNLSVSGVIKGYTTTTDLNGKLNLKANVADVYSKTDADSTFIKKTDSIGVFVEKAGGGQSGKTSVCQAIGAATSVEFKKAALKNNLLKDVVDEGLPLNSEPTYAQKLEERKKKICQNIGAAYRDEVMLKQKDTGWLSIVQGEGVSYPNMARCRQIGNMVTIEGFVITDGKKNDVFSLPLQIDAPKNALYFYNHNMYFYYNPNDKTWNAEPVSSSGVTFNGGFITITYFV